MIPLIAETILTIVVAAALFVGPCGWLLYLGEAQKTAAEQLLLAAVGVAISVAVVSGWGDYGNVHGGGILLVEIMFVSVPVILAELILLAKFRTKVRILQFSITLFYPAALLYSARTFGS